MEPTDIEKLIAANNRMSNALEEVSEYVSIIQSNTDDNQVLHCCDRIEIWCAHGLGSDGKELSE